MNFTHKLLFLLLLIYFKTVFIIADGIIRLKRWLVDNPKALKSALVDELRDIQTFAALRPADRMIIYIGAVFTESAATSNETNMHIDTLQALTSEKIQQRHFIGALEWFCGTHMKTSLKKYFPVLLKHAYDADLLDEDIILQWSQDSIQNQHCADRSMIDYDTLEELRESAKPFIIWLQEADEESDDDNDDDEESNEED